MRRALQDHRARIWAVSAILTLSLLAAWALGIITIEHVPAAEKVRQANELQHRADQLYLDGDYRGAIEAYARAISLAPRFPAAWYNKGLLHERLGEYDAAEYALSAAITLDRTCHDAWAARGNVRMRVLHLEEALEDFNYAVQLKPDDAAIRASRGRVHGLLGNIELAKADLAEAVVLDPEGPVGTMAAEWLKTAPKCCE